MIFTLLTAVVILPFLVEWFVVASPEPSPVKRSWLFYLLVPVMGMLVYGWFAVLTGREFLGLAGSVLYYGGLTAVSNKKCEVLKSPFNAHDFDNLRNLVIYPEFYISYVGWPILVLVITLFSGLVGTALWLETPFPFYSSLPAYVGWPLVLFLWWAGTRLTLTALRFFITEDRIAQLGIKVVPSQDVARFGLFPTVLLYQALLAGKCHKPALRNRILKAEVKQKRPSDIIAIQGESYFDLARFFAKLPATKKPSSSLKWKPLRALEKAGVTTGQVNVPAWGAYTMQTEFSFLAGLPNDALGIDRINPYMRLAQKPLATSVTALREAGYRTVCIHPAKKEFFRRTSVMPNLGFDDFIGLEAFEQAPVFGKYIADDALADQIETILEAHHALRPQQPLFLFIITIESHGPWAPGRLSAHLDEARLIAENPTDDHAFALYQKHMENLLSLYRRLSVDAGKTALKVPRTVALYGDHMPALPGLFNQHGFTETAVDYLLWASNGQATGPKLASVETFAETVFSAAGIRLTETIHKTI